ncbi:MAG: family 16 glycoside hydrolase, partial [Pseudomonadales bacterium]
WQSYDIVFRRPRFDQHGCLLAPAKLTMFHNGILVHHDRQLWGPTSWLKNRPYTSHADRLPLALQDHGNPIRFRNIWLRELPEVQQPGDARAQPHGYIRLTLDELDRCVGSYLIDDKMPLEIARIDDRLFFQIMGRERLELVPASKHKFHFRWTGGMVLFPETQEQKVAHFEFKMGRRTYQVVRVTSASTD